MPYLICTRLFFASGSTAICSAQINSPTPPPLSNACLAPRLFTRAFLTRTSRRTLGHHGRRSKGKGKGIRAPMPRRLRSTQTNSNIKRIQHCCAMKIFGDHGTKEMLGVVDWKVWPVSNFAQQHATKYNNMQQSVQTDATCNIQQSWVTTILRPFARGLIYLFAKNNRVW